MATAGAGTASAPEAGDEPAGRRVGELERDAVAARAVADQGDELGALAADAVALQQLEPRAAAPLGGRDARALRGELGAAARRSPARIRRARPRP